MLTRLQVKEIRFSNKGYFGAADQYSSDIAVVILEEKLAIGAAVLPACVDWISIQRAAYPTENSPAQVSNRSFCSFVSQCLIECFMIFFCSRFLDGE